MTKTTGATPSLGPDPVLGTISAKALRLLLDLYPGERDGTEEVGSLTVRWAVLRALGMTHEQISALVGAGHAELFVQANGRATADGGWSRPRDRRVTERSFLALTESGAAFASRLLAKSPPVTLRCGGVVVVVQPPDVGGRPRWDAADGQLWYAGRIVREFCRSALSQRSLLDAFEVATWRHRVENPFHGAKAKRRLRYAIEGLHEGQEPLTLRFHADGNGGATWEAKR
jgi:hypothetical protein